MPAETPEEKAKVEAAAKAAAEAKAKADAEANDKDAKERANEIIRAAKAEAADIVSRAEEEAELARVASAPTTKKGRRDYGGTVTFSPSEGKFTGPDGKSLGKTKGK